MFHFEFNSYLDKVSGLCSELAADAGSVFTAILSSISNNEEQQRVGPADAGPAEVLAAVQPDDGNGYEWDVVLASSQPIPDRYLHEEEHAAGSPTIAIPRLTPIVECDEGDGEESDEEGDEEQALEEPFAEDDEEQPLAEAVAELVLAESVASEVDEEQPLAEAVAEFVLAESVASEVDEDEDDEDEDVEDDHLPFNLGMIEGRHLPIVLKRSLCILRKLGEGGCGLVRICLMNGQEKVVLKVATNGDLAEMLKEAHYTSICCDHPNVIKPLGFYIADKQGLILEYCNYSDMSRFYKADKSNPQRVETILRLFLQVAQAIKHVHDQGVLHRDIKPENILLQFDKGTVTAKLADFGLAKQRKFGGVTGWCGTKGFMAPEFEFDEPYDTQVDVYAFGVTVWSVFAGGHYAQDWNYQLPELGNVVPTINELIADCTRYFPEERIDIDQVIERVKSCIHDV